MGRYKRKKSWNKNLEVERNMIKGTAVALERRRQQGRKRRWGEKEIWAENRSCSQSEWPRFCK